MVKINRIPTKTILKNYKNIRNLEAQWANYLSVIQHTYSHQRIQDLWFVIYPVQPIDCWVITEHILLSAVSTQSPEDMVKLEYETLFPPNNYNRCSFIYRKEQQTSSSEKSILVSLSYIFILVDTIYFFKFNCSHSCSVDFQCCK